MLFFVRLLICLVISFEFALVASTSASPASNSLWAPPGPYYRNTAPNEWNIVTAALTVSGYDPLNGTLWFSASFTAPLFGSDVSSGSQSQVKSDRTDLSASSNSNANEGYYSDIVTNSQHIMDTKSEQTSPFALTRPIILPHSQELDSIFGCSPFTYDKNDEGQLYNRLLTSVSTFGWPFTVAIVQAVGKLQRPLPIEPGDIIPLGPIITLHSADGRLLIDHLQRRRQCFSQARNTTVTLSLQNCTSSYPPLFGTVTASGSLVPDELASFTNFTNNLGFVETPSNYRTWSDYQSNFIDPCVHRLPGIYCEAGHVVSITAVPSLTRVYGTLASSLGNFAYLRNLQLPGSATAYLWDVLPDSICNLQELITLQLDGNSLTGIPNCLSSCSELRSLILTGNPISLLPPLSPLTNLIVLLAVNAQLVTLPPWSQILQPTLQMLDLSANPGLALNASLLSMLTDGGTALQTIALGNTGMQGQLSFFAFDDLVNLSQLDISSNPLLTGSLPTLQHDASLVLLNLQLCSFTGSIPASWSELHSLRTLYLQGSSLTGDLSPLKSLPVLNLIDLTGNRLSLLPEDKGDIGHFLARSLPDAVSEVHLDSNLIVGQSWASDYFSTLSRLTTLTMQNNQLQALPTDLFSSSLTYMDFSFNALDIFGPVSAPVIGVKFLDLRGNPRLSPVGGLPPWVGFSSVYQADLITNAFCLPLTPTTVPRMQLFTDPSFYNYNRCVCAAGYFGAAPWCVGVPADVVLKPGDAPVSTTVDHQLQLINQGNATLVPVLRDAAGRFTTFSQLLVSELNVSSSFTDRWFTKQLLSQPLTLTTNFRIQLQSFRWNSATQTENRNDVAADASTTPASTEAQPVRTIKLQLSLSPSAFASGDSISISSSSNVIVKLDASNIHNMSETNTSSFARLQASQSGDEHLLIQIDVPGNAAAVSLTGVEQMQSRFNATYSYSYSCPTGFQLLQADSGFQCLAFVAPLQYLAGRAGTYTYECAAVSAAPSDPTVTIQASANPAEINYRLCRCPSGMFGVPPLCDVIPTQVIAGPFTIPTENDATSLSNIASLGQLLYRLPANATISPAASLLPSSQLSSNQLSNSTQVAALSRGWPSSISDAWYGSRRSTPGFRSSWMLDLRDLRIPINAVGFPSNATIFGAEKINQTLINPFANLQPVRSIDINLHVNIAQFSKVGNSLSLFEFQESSGNLQLLLQSSSDRPWSNSSCIPFNSSQVEEGYLLAYGEELASMNESCVIHATVYSNAATLVFSSLQSSDTHFVATYSFKFVCPSGRSLAQDEFGNWSCATPTAPNVLARLLTLSLSIGGALLLLMLVWLMFERFRRAREKEKHDAELLARQGATSSDGLVLKKAEQDELQRRSRSMRKDASMELVSVLIDLGSCASNWVLVTGYLHSATDLQLAYVAIVCVSTVSIVANTAPRLVNVRHKWIAASHVKPISAGEEGWQGLMETCDKELSSLKLQILAALFSSVPFTGLNVVHSAMMAQAGEALTTSLLASLLLSVFQLGMSAAQILRFVAVKSCRDTCRHQIFLNWVELKRKEATEKRDRKASLHRASPTVALHVENTGEATPAFEGPFNMIEEEMSPARLISHYYTSGVGKSVPTADSTSDSPASEMDVLPKRSNYTTPASDKRSFRIVLNHPSRSPTSRTSTIVPSSP